MAINFENICMKILLLLNFTKRFYDLPLPIISDTHFRLFMYGINGENTILSIYFFLIAERSLFLSKASICAYCNINQNGLFIKNIEIC